MPVGSTEAPGRDTTNAAQADHGDGETRLVASPNTSGNRSIIHYGSVKQRPLSVKRDKLAERCCVPLLLPILQPACGLLDLEKQMLPIGSVRAHFARPPPAFDGFRHCVLSKTC